MSATGAVAGASLGRVLCVDDEPHVLRALRWLLQQDFEVHVAQSAREGLRLVAQHDFDVVLSDQRMPDVTGVEFLRAVRQEAPRAMRILLTGYSDLDAMVRSVNESEVYRFITKPWNVKELPKLIADAAQIARQTPAPPAEDDAAAGASTTPAATPARIAARAPIEGTECIVLVDDDVDVHAIVDRAFDGKSRIRHAYSLADAVRILNDRPAGVLVSEIRIRTLDATRLMRLMKAKHPEMVNVVFSAKADVEVVLALINQGQVYRFIPKPLNEGFIRVILAAALKRHDSLVRDPALQNRYAVDATPQDTADSLVFDVARSVAPSIAARPATAITGPQHAVDMLPMPTAAPGGLVSRLVAGLRRLIGA
jgi:serine/threonine-protein kinase